MTFVSVSDRAREDLKDVLEYRGMVSARAATRLADGFDEAIERLIQFPESGSPRSDLAPGVRMVILREFRLLLFYHVRHGDETVQLLVLRVLRQERRTPRRSRVASSRA